MKKELSIKKLFHSLANEGYEIAMYRQHKKELSGLPAKRIEILLLLKKLKQEFFINK